MRIVFAAFIALLASTAGLHAQIQIETLPVGNPGNHGEWAGQSIPVAGNIMGFGFDRLCGSVAYPYEIGKYEITVAQYTLFLNAVAATDTYALYNTFVMPTGSSYSCNIVRLGASGAYTYVVGDGSPEAFVHWASRPVSGIAWADAARFANWMHNGQPVGPQNASTTEDGSYSLNGATTNPQIQPILRNPGATWVIPSEDEWYKSAYHKNDGVTPNYWKYPTSFSGINSPFGYTTPDNNVLDPDPGNSANFHIGSPDDDCIGPPYTRTPVGEFENSGSPYGTCDQGGNVWEWTDTRYLNVNGGLTTRRVIRGGSFYPSVIEQQPDGFKCMHAAWRGNEFPAAQVARYGFRLARVNNDCNTNGTLDQVELGLGDSDAFDRNFNGILDVCDIASHTSADCNTNGIPDESEVGAVTPAPYGVDDGVPADLIQALGYPDDTEPEGYMVWMNQFTVVAGREYVGAIDTGMIQGLVPSGTPFLVMLWSDPNGDGNPSDAAVLASASGIMSPTLSPVSIPPTYAGPSGTNFFVGVLMHVTDVPGTFPLSYDDSSDFRVSWLYWDTLPIDPNNLAAVPNGVNLHTWWTAWGNWMVRAIPAIVVTQLADANHNGIPDICEGMCSTCRGDMNNSNTVDGDDVAGFVQCFVGGSGTCACADIYPVGAPDGVLNSNDLSEFISKLLLDNDTACP